jgi:hypothetical protein
VRGGDLGGGGEAGAQLVGWMPVGLVEGDDDLEVLGLFGAGGDCDVATPVVRSRAWSPTSVTWPLKTLPGRASTVTSAGWFRETLTMSVSSTLTSAVMTDMSARVISVEPSAFWMPTTTVSPSRTGTLVTRPSKGARLWSCRGVVVAALGGDGLVRRGRAAESVCALAWRERPDAAPGWRRRRRRRLSWRRSPAWRSAFRRRAPGAVKSSFFCSRSALAWSTLASAVFSAAI